MKSPTAANMFISLRTDQISITSSNRNHLAASQKLGSSKKSAPLGSTEGKSSRKDNRSPNPGVRSFLHPASPREIPAVLLSLSISKGSLNSESTNSTNFGSLKSISASKLSLKPSFSERKEIKTKQRYQTQSNNPFLKHGYRHIGSLEKKYPEIENFQSSSPLELNLTPRGAVTDRSAGTAGSRNELFNPAVLVTWSKKFEKYQQQIEDRAKHLQEQAKNYESQSKKHEETAIKIKEMRSNLQIESDHSDKLQKRKQLPRPSSVGNAKRLNGTVNFERNKQNFLEKKKDELIKAEEVAIERLRASQNIESQAKETLNRLSAMRIAIGNAQRSATNGSKAARK